MLAYVTVSMADAEGEEWFSLAVAHEYVSNLRVLLTYDSQVGGHARFSISAGDLAMREESLDTKRCFAFRITFWTRLSTIDSALTGTQLVSTALVSHASSLPTRAAILEFNKKQLAPVTVAKAASVAENTGNPNPTSRKRPYEDVSSGGGWNSYPQETSSGSAGNNRKKNSPCKLHASGKCKWGRNCNYSHDMKDGSSKMR